jgi:hypothetical protein
MKSDVTYMTTYLIKKAFTKKSFKVVDGAAIPIADDNTNITIPIASWGK